MKVSRQLLVLLYVNVVLACGLNSGHADDHILRDLEFANVDGHPLKLDLYLTEAVQAPLVVYIHGGGWRAGSKDSCPLSWLTKHGYHVASISYRLTSVATFPAQIHDCKAAVRWLRAHAEKYGYDSNQVAVAGSSAGGHLAALLGTTAGVKELEGDVGGNLDQSSRVQAVIDYYGATDFLQRTKTQPHKTIKEGSVVRLLLGGPADEKQELARLASSAFHVTPDDPPLLVFHGREDEIVLLGQSQQITMAYQQVQLPVKFVVLENSGHGGKEFHNETNRNFVLEFLQRHLN